MTRVLTAAKVQVSPAAESEYIDTVQQLSWRLARRGQHVWLFRHRATPGLFLEFTEGQDQATHRSAGPVDAEERLLETRLHALGRYEDNAPISWDEVSFGT
ncbi:MAG: hypothetical protein ACRELE_02045 [Gemmatimonadales bacterium]